MPLADPPTINAGDIVEMTMRGFLCGQTILTVTHWKRDEGDPSQMDVALDSFNSKLREAGGLTDMYIAAAAGNYSWVELVLQVIHPIRFARFTYPAVLSGTQAAASKTADLAAVILRKSWFATDAGLKLGKGRQGELHYAPVPDTMIDEGLVDADYRINFLLPLGEKYTTVVDAGAGGGWIPVLYHRTADPISTTELNRWETRPEARVMRRRTVGVGI